MRSIEFKVQGELPPKKDGANSMWGKEKCTEPKRLIALRKKALEELGSKADFIDGKPYFGKTESIRLELSIQVASRRRRKSGDKGSGDLDNFITGVCDGLMNAHPRAKINHLFRKPENSDVDPAKPIMFADDSQVTQICAKRRFGPADEYVVALAGVNEE